jgi:hypothetical protein
MEDLLRMDSTQALNSFVRSWIGIEVETQVLDGYMQKREKMSVEDGDWSDSDVT